MLFLHPRFCLLQHNHEICWRWLCCTDLWCSVHGCFIEGDNPGHQGCTMGLICAPSGAPKHNLVYYSFFMQKCLWTSLESIKYPVIFLMVKWRSCWLCLLSLPGKAQARVDIHCKWRGWLLAEIEKLSVPCLLHPVRAHPSLQSKGCTVRERKLMQQDSHLNEPRLLLFSEIF